MYRIAIVDDDYMVRESTKAVIERNFKEENFQVECFSTFSQLQSELSQELFTVYILDIELPDGNGLELAKEIRKQGQLAPNQRNKASHTEQNK